MYRFEAAEEKDARIIAGLRCEIYKDTYRGIYSDKELDLCDSDSIAEDYLSVIKDPDRSVYIYRDGEDAAAYLIFSQKEDPKTVFLEALYIRRDLQRSGVGKQAFELLRSEAARLGAEEIRCWCNFHNIPAMRFYEAMGGSVIRRNYGGADRSLDGVLYSFALCK